MVYGFLASFDVYSAEKEGFEPPEVWPSTVFKTAAFDHSAISPCGYAGANIGTFFNYEKVF